MTNLLKLLSLKRAVEIERDHAEMNDTQISLFNVLLRFFIGWGTMAFLAMVLVATLAMSTLVLIYGIR